MQNGVPYKGDTITEIKNNAKETAHLVRGASATSLLTSARSQIRLAQAKENEGDLKGALSALTKSASLVQLLLDTPEFKADSHAGKKGVLFKEFMDFQQVRTLVLERVQPISRHFRFDFQKTGRDAPLL